MDTIQFMIPVLADNPSNASFQNKWTPAARRKRIREATELALLQVRGTPFLPAVVTLIRVGAGELDDHDGLRTSMKHIVDAVAKWLPLPRNVKGHAEDKHPDVTWQYEQRKAPRYVYGVEVVIQFRSTVEARPPRPHPLPNPPPLSDVEIMVKREKVKARKVKRDAAKGILPTRVIRGDSRIAHLPGCTEMFPCQLCRFRASRQ